MNENNEGKSKQHPNATWNDCIEFIKIVDRKKLGKVSYNTIAEEYGLKSYTTKSFTQKVSTSKQFGLIETSNLTIQLADVARKILYPTSDSEVKKITLECFSRPTLYKQLIERYDGKAVPDVNLLSNVLFNDFDITKAGKDNAAKVFIQNAEMMGVLKGGVLCYEKNEEQIEETPIKQTAEEKIDEKEQEVQEKKKEENNNMYFTINIPTRAGISAKIQIPYDLENDEAELVKNMLNANIEVYFKGKFGI